MAIPAYMWIYDDQGNLVKSTSQVQGRENSAEVIGVQHQVYIPTDSDTGALMSTRKHEPFVVTKQFCSASPILYKACSSGQTLSQVKVSWYQINSNGQEEEYFRQTLTNAKVVSVAPIMDNVKDKSTESYGHLEQVAFRYQQIQWEYLDGNISTQDEWTQRS